MGFAAINYSMMFDSINTYTEKKDIIRELRISTGKKRKYLNKLFDISKNLNGKPVWLITDLEKFFKRDLNVLPFFRPEFFIGGYDHNGIGRGEMREKFERENNCKYEENTIMYVTACGLKKMILILSLGEMLKD